MRNALLLIVAAVAILACTKSSSNPAGPGTTDYFPLTLGNWWTWNTYDTDSTGARVAGSDQTEHDSIVGTEVFQGHTVTLMLTVTDSSRDTARFYKTASGDIVAWSDTSSDGSGKGMWRTAIHMTAGTRVDTFFLDLGTGPMPFLTTTKTVVGGSTSITVPAGTFTTTVFTDSGSTDISAFFPGGSSTSLQSAYMANNVGPVKWVYESETSIPPFGGGKSGLVQELVAYHIY